MVPPQQVVQQLSPVDTDILRGREGYELPEPEGKVIERRVEQHGHAPVDALTPHTTRCGHRHHSRPKVARR